MFKYAKFIGGYQGDNKMNESSYLLGIAFALLVQCRGHLIRNEDTEGVTLIEDQYQELMKMINELYYKHLGEEKNANQGR
jgi:hypothetical protein